jgi:hypothetical protein
MSGENSFDLMPAPTGGEMAIQKVAETVSALANTDQSRAVAEVQAALVIAKGSPRDEMLSRDRLLKACQRPALAGGAVYNFPRGGQSVSGPSIRLAEVAARCWGNMQYGFRELSRRNGESEAEAFAWDLETNTKAVRQFAVKHIRDTKSGPKHLKDERDIYEMIANQSQRRVRACILEIVPGDIIEDAVAECEKTLRASLPKDKDMAGVIKDMIAAFGAFGVKREAIEKRLGHRLSPDATHPAEIMNLKKVYASIKDGFSKAEDWFDIKADREADSLNEKIQQQEKE